MFFICLGITVMVAAQVLILFVVGVRVPYPQPNRYSVVCRKHSVVCLRWDFSSVGSEHMASNHEVGGSNPSSPTKATYETVLTLQQSNFIRKT